MRTGGLVAASGDDREVMQVLEQRLVFVDGQDHGNSIPFLVDYKRSPVAAISIHSSRK